MMYTFICTQNVYIFSSCLLLLCIYSITIFYTGIKFTTFYEEVHLSEGVIVSWEVTKESEICITEYKLTVKDITSGNVTTKHRLKTFAYVKMEEGKIYELKIKAIGFNSSKTLIVNF